MKFRLEGKGANTCAIGNGHQRAAFREGGRAEGEGGGFGGRARFDMQDIEMMEGRCWDYICGGIFWCRHLLGRNSTKKAKQWDVRQVTAVEYYHLYVSLYAVVQARRAFRHVG